MKQKKHKKPKETQEEAKALLSDVKESSYFNVHLGTNIANLHELRDSLAFISDASFKHHVNNEKNDFSDWVSHAVKDKFLAAELKKVKTKEETREVVAARIAELEEVAAGDTFKDNSKTTAMDFLMGLIIGFIIGLIVALMR